MNLPFKFKHALVLLNLCFIGSQAAVAAEKADFSQGAAVSASPWGFYAKPGDPKAHPLQDRMGGQRIGTLDLGIVCDGHGKHGERHADLAVNTFLLQARALKPTAEAAADYMQSVFAEIERQLVAKDWLGGTTAVSYIASSSDDHKTYDTLTLAHAGDSRALVTSFEGIESLKFEVLATTRDHSPEEPEEAARVKAAGGTIFRNKPVREFVDFVANHKPEAETLEAFLNRIYPAFGYKVAMEQLSGSAMVLSKPTSGRTLNMTRSLGDKCFKQAGVGVIATPTVTSYSLPKGLNAVILASDGLWDVMLNEEAAQIVWQTFIELVGSTDTPVKEQLPPIAKAAARRLGKQALKNAQKIRYPMDDIGILVRFLAGSGSSADQSAGSMAQH